MIGRVKLRLRHRGELLEFGRLFFRDLREGILLGLPPFAFSKSLSNAPIFASARRRM
jgi:hypothetical protein